MTPGSPRQTFLVSTKQILEINSNISRLFSEIIPVKESIVHLGRKKSTSSSASSSLTSLQHNSTKQHHNQGVVCDGIEDVDINADLERYMKNADTCLRELTSHVMTMGPGALYDSAMLNAEAISSEVVALLQALQCLYEDTLPYVGIETFKFLIPVAEHIAKRTLKLISCLLKASEKMTNNSQKHSQIQKANIELTPWLDVFQMLLEGHQGALISDLARIYGDSIEALIGNSCSNSSSTSTTSAYMLNAFLAPPGLFQKMSIHANHSKPSLFSKQTTTTMTTTTSSESISDTQMQDRVIIDEKINAVKGMFPELGDGYIEACLLYFNRQADLLVDALLSNNLPSHLTKIPTNLARNKKDQNITLGRVNMDDPNRYTDPDEVRFKALQKERIRAMERQQELDRLLIEREYADDYDDQYDDITSFSVEGGRSNQEVLDLNPSTRHHVLHDATVTSEAAGSSQVSSHKKKHSTDKTNASNQPKIDWGKRMAETKRLNTLIKEEEAEIKFWKDMQFSNHKVNATVDEENGEEEVLDGMNSGTSTSSKDTANNIKILHGGAMSTLMEGSPPTARRARP